jgi:UDP-galactopyranose mutase
MEKIYDFLIVGAGLFGSVSARELTDRGFKCLVIDKRKHIAGNCYTEEIENIHVHKYGAHIFHTNNIDIWKYVNQFAEFNRYTNSPIANYKGELYNLPFNMNTFYQLWRTLTPQQAKEKIKEQISEFNYSEPRNLEEQALSLVGMDIYKKLIKGYTEKQWGRKATELPAFIIKRLPLRFTYDNNYFNDAYQGIPIGGYTKLFDKMLNGIEVILNCDFLKNREHYRQIAKKVIYTGALDEFYDYEFGQLEYRSLKFHEELLNIDNFQGNAVVNYTDEDTPFTRIIEHKHFEFGNQQNTVISKEYSIECKEGNDPYYPINNAKNNQIFSQYILKAHQENNIYFGGRLAEYKYYDMHQVIASALQMINKIMYERNE